MSARLVHAILAGRATGAIGLPDVCEPAVGTVGRQLVLLRAKLAGGADRAVTRRLGVAGIHGIVPRLAHFHPTKLSTRALVAFRTVLKKVSVDFYLQCSQSWLG